MSAKVTETDLAELKELIVSSQKTSAERTLGIEKQIETGLKTKDWNRLSSI